MSVPVLYAVFGCLWIMASDLVLESLHLPPHIVTRIAMIKGWIYVAGSTALIVVVMRSAWASLEGAYADLASELGQRRAAQEETLRLAAELEQRVEERTIHLRSTLAELAMFNDSISHDLRAPLLVVAGYAQTLEEDYSSCLSKDGLQYLARMKLAAHRMENMINGLLALSRHGRSALRLEDFDASRHQRIVDEIWEEVVVSHHGRPFQFERGDFPDIRCDPRLLEHVWRNALSNAAKYTRGRTPSVIRVDFCGGWFRVRDNGVGFDPTSAERLFKPFQRLHPSEEFEGDGIGLALAHRVIDRHGGKIEAESQPGEGTELRFQVP